MKKSDIKAGNFAININSKTGIPWEITEDDINIMMCNPENYYLIDTSLNILKLSKEEYDKLHDLYSYELHLDTEEAKELNFTSDKYEGYIYVDCGDYYLHCKGINGFDSDLSLLRKCINNLGIPYEDIRNP